MWNKGILVCGFYGYHNLGDEAMLQGLRHWLRRCDRNLPLTVYSKDPADTRQRHGVNALDNRYAPRRRIQLQQWIRHTLALLQHRYFILGGGDLLRDAPARDVASEWLHPLERAISMGKRTLVIGISVGNIWRETTQSRLKTALNQVDLIAVRDQISRQRLITLGITQPIFVMSDLALEVVSPQPKRSINNTHPTIGISIRALAGRIPHQTDQVFYKRLATTIDHLIEHYSANIHLLPFQAYPDAFRRQHSPSVDDEIAIAQVSQLSRYPKKLNIHQRFLDLETLIDCISSLDIVIGTRLHSIILAAGLGIPVVAIDYAPKVRGFMSEIGQLDYCIDPASFTLQPSVALIVKILHNYSAVQAQLSTAIKTYRTRMNDVDVAFQQILLP